jgi:hypothetical protein
VEAFGGKQAEQMCPHEDLLRKVAVVQARTLVTLTAVHFLDEFEEVLKHVLTRRRRKRRSLQSHPQQQ